MKFPTAVLILFLSLLSFSLAQKQPCYNQADPDNGMGNYCYCQGDNTCYFGGGGPDPCNPVGRPLGGCPAPVH
ncbi:hypothetical protein VTN96DRAFT_1991 [Rasamsonia emersonii]